jgi:hypothetical protein
VRKAAEFVELLRRLPETKSTLRRDVTTTQPR